ncbi:MAG: FecR domain-containing protein [Rikenellaceae bacterium]|jgi:ferric-dicitrate binding protein FerR (iron transport regulator)|nr:FecR domain-containing protein [Rikenellaceae bacterium]
MTHDIPLKLIVARFDGTISPEESAVLDEWLTADETNMRIYGEIGSLWEGVRRKVADYNPDSDRYWNIISDYIDNEARRKSRRSVSWRRIRYTAVAASVTLAIGLGTLWRMHLVEQRSDSLAQQSLEYFGGEDKRHVLLPDGSEVWLRANSSLTYREDRQKNTREATISGEAFFDVSHDGSRAFVVNVDGAAITVHGTRFGVSSMEDGSDVTVALVEGSVSMSAGGRQVTLAPGDGVSYDRGSGLWRTEKIDAELVSVWTLDKLHFERKSLGHICRYLSAWYDIAIDVDPHLTTGQAYTLTVSDQSVDEVMLTLSQISGFTYRFDRNGNLRIR